MTRVTTRKWMRLCAMATLGFASFVAAIHSAEAATHYVRAGATGNGSGQDWTNAYPALPTTLERGGVYYVADGTYGTYKFNTPLSGTNKILVKKATESDHGTATGWNSGYGDGEALFTGTSPVWQFGTGYIDIDGVTGKGKSPGTYGFKVLPSSTKCVNEFGSAVKFNSGANITNLALRHIDFSWENSSSVCTSAVPALLYTDSAASDTVTIESSYFHHAPGYALYIGAYDPNPGGTVQNNYTIRDNYFYMLGGGGGVDHHWELMWLMNVDNSYIYNNIVEDVVHSEGQTGWVMFAKANNLNIFGNVFFCTDPACIVGGNGVVATWSADAYKNDSVRVYNNTFAKLRGVFNDFGMRFTHNSVSDTNMEVKNNLYCNTKFTWTGVNVQSGEACGCGQPCSGSNAQTGVTTGSFVDYLKSNFRLASPTAAGDGSVGSVVRADMDGKTRGADGTFDRGAYEFGGITSPPAPTNLIVR